MFFIHPTHYHNLPKYLQYYFETWRTADLPEDIEWIEKAAAAKEPIPELITQIHQSIHQLQQGKKPKQLITDYDITELEYWIGGPEYKRLKAQYNK